MANVKGKWATTGRGHDLFPGHATNGKGDKNRTSDDEQYRKNYDEINWKSVSGAGRNITSADTGAAGVSEELGSKSSEQSSCDCGLQQPAAILESGLGDPCYCGSSQDRDTLPAVPQDQHGDIGGTPRKSCC